MDSTAILQNPKLSKLEKDIISLASIAAIEIDDYITTKEIENFEALNKLIEEISNSLIKLKFDHNTDSHQLINLVDPMTMVVMNKALAASILGQPKKTLAEVIQETKNIIIRLKKISLNPSTTEKTELEKMRSFCEELSRKARANEPSIYMRQQRHPFGK